MPDIDWKITPPKPAPTLAIPHTEAVALLGTTSAGNAIVLAVYAAYPNPAIASTISAPVGPFITKGPNSRDNAITNPNIPTDIFRALGISTPFLIIN